MDNAKPEEGPTRLDDLVGTVTIENASENDIPVPEDTAALHSPHAPIQLGDAPDVPAHGPLPAAVLQNRSSMDSSGNLRFEAGDVIYTC